jgi:hypothetical protein
MINIISVGDRDRVADRNPKSSDRDLKKRSRSKIFWIAFRRQIAIRIAIDCDGLLEN